MKISNILCVAALVLVSGCFDVTYTDVSSDSANRELIGATFRTVAKVEAYGIRPNSQAPMKYFTVIPPPGIAGRTIGVVVEIPIGTLMTVDRVYRTNRILDNPMTYEVSFKEFELPEKLPIRLDLYHVGNKGEKGYFLNPMVYQKM